MSQVIYRSFAGGIVAPALYARVDTSKYQTGLRTCENFIIARHGGAYNRPGTKYLGEVVDSTKQSRLIPFIFNNDQTYIIEFADQKIRFFRNSARVLETAKTITAITQANPAVVTSATHSFTNGDTVLIEEPSSGILTGMMKRLVGRTFVVANGTVNTFELQGEDSSSYDAFTGTADVSRVYEVSSPYTESDLPDLHFVQSADVITIVHPDYAPRELSRTGHTSWTLAEVPFIPTQDHPTGGAGSGSAGAVVHKYKVTALDPVTGEESLPAVEAPVTITNITQANPGVVSAAGHAYNDGDIVLIESVAGMTEVNDRRFTVSGSVAGVSFELQGEDTTSYTAYSSGGTSSREEIYFTAAKAAVGNEHTIIWTAVSGVKDYIVYKADNDIFGFIGNAGSATFTNDGIPVDGTDTAPRANNPFRVAGQYPSTVAYYQQRRMFGGSDDEPETFYGSRTGFHSNFTTSFPLRDDDSVRATLSGRRVNRIRSMIDLGILVVFTTDSEGIVQGNGAGVLTPTEINSVQQTYYGSSNLQPLIIGKNAIYVQGRGSIVRDLLEDFEVSGYRGNDLTVFSSHLFEKYTLTDLAYQQVPNSIAWFVRSDGKLLGLTYVSEQQIFAWHEHSIGTTVESVEAIPSGNEDLLYVISKRTVNGSTVRYIEEMQTRLIQDQEDMVFMDATFTYDGTNTDTSNTATLTGGTDWDQDEILTLTFSTAIPGIDPTLLLDQEFHMFDSDGAIVRLTVITAPAETTTGTVFTVRPDRVVPTGIQGVATATWTRAKKVLYGLHHLVAEDLSVFGDAFVVGSPNDPDQATYTVAADGSITLDRAYGVIHLGIPYISDIETLDVDVTQGSIKEWKSNPTAIGLIVESTRGVYAGTQPPASTDDSNKDLFEYKIRNLEEYDDPTDLKTGYIEVNAPGSWDHGGRVFVRQIDPLPVGILGVLPLGSYPIGGRR